MYITSMGLNMHDTYIKDVHMLVYMSYHRQLTHIPVQYIMGSVMVSFECKHL